MHRSATGLKETLWIAERGEEKKCREDYTRVLPAKELQEPLHILSRYNHKLKSDAVFKIICK